MNKYRARILIFALLVISFLTFSFGSGEREEAVNTITETENYYELILEGDVLKVYSFDGENKDAVVEGKSAPLRKSDEEMLKKGIKTNDFSEVLMLFEDFVG